MPPRSYIYRCVFPIDRAASKTFLTLTMRNLATLSLLLLGATGTAAWKDQCEKFAIESLDGVQLIKALYYDANAFVNLTTPYQSISTSALPAFCRLQLNLTTNPVTGKTAYSELWLPDAWNTRTLGFGNGGWSGGGIVGPSASTRSQPLILCVPPSV
jgi:hypothetical protein